MQQHSASNQPTNNFFPEGFTPLRNGLRAHIKAGKFSPFDLGVYTFLHFNADWATGIYTGCALAIAFGFGDSALKQQVQKSLRRLRDAQYINYPRGNGARNSYAICIHKYVITTGERSGLRLNAWKNGELNTPVYERWNCQNGQGTVRELSGNSGVHGQPDEKNEVGNSSENSPERSRNGSGTVTEPSLDNTNKSIPTILSKNTAEGVVDTHSPTQNLSGKAKSNPKLLADMRSIWDFHLHDPWNTSPADIRTCHALAEEHGATEFLLAFDCWCRNDADDQIEMRYAETLRFPLLKFFPQFDYYLQRAQTGEETKWRTKKCPPILEWLIVNEPVRQGVAQ